MLLDAIHEDLVRTLGTDGVTHSTVTKFARNANLVPTMMGRLTNRFCLDANSPD
jgi:hypothetical protein